MARSVIVAVGVALLAAGCGATSVTEISGPDPVRCQVTLASSAGMIAADGGSLSVSVDSARDCTWNASSEAAWATLSPASGQGAGTIGVTITATEQPTVRTATIVVNNQRLDIPQEARPCRFTLSDARTDVGASGGEVGLSVTTGDACTWRPFTTVPWISVPTASRTGSAALTFDIAPNAGAAREGSVTIGDQSFSVVQGAVGSTTVPCTPLVQPTAIDVAAAAASDSVRLDVGATCEWSAASAATWLTLTSPPAGRGSTTIRFSIAQNAGAARSGTLTIAGQVVTVRQTATAAPPPCTYAIDPAARAFPTAGGDGRVQVTARAGCAWTATSNATWAQLAVTQGSGNGEVRYTVQSNTATSARSARLTIAGRVHNVTQAAAPPPCSFTLDPTAQTIGATGGPAQFRVTTQSGCQWAATTQANWIQLTSAAATGNGDVVFTAQANSSTASRSGTVVVNNQTHTVTQSGAAAPCTYSLTPPSRTMPAAGGQAQFRVVTQNGCAWSATAGSGWVEVTGGSGSGSGSADVSYTVQANSAAESRSTSISVAGQQAHAITQDGAAPTCTYSIAPSALTLAPAGGGGRFTVTTQAGCTWSASPSASTSWLTISSGTGTGAGDVVYSVQANSTADTRSVGISVAGQTHTVMQTGVAAPVCTYSIAPQSQTIAAAGGEGRVTVTTQTGCTWTASAPPPWMTYTTGSGSGTGDVVYNVQANTGTEMRSAGIVVGGQTHTVTQTGAAPACTYSIAPGTRTLPSLGGEGRFTVTTQAGCTWNATGGASWLTITTGSGSGLGDVVYVALLHVGIEPRSADIAVAGQVHTVTQSAPVPLCTYTLSPPALTFTPAGGEGRVTVTTQAGCGWSVGGAPTWVTPASTSGTGPGELVYAVQPNTAAEQRLTTLTVSGQSHSITQSGTPATPPPTP